MTAPSTRLQPATPTSNSAVPRNNARRRKRSTRNTAIAWLIIAVVMLPLGWIVLLSLEPSETVSNATLDLSSLSFHNYANVLHSLPLLRMYGNTILLAVVSVVIGSAVSFMLSFAVAVMVFKRRRRQSLIRYYVIVGMAVPVYILLFPVYRLVLTVGLYGSYWSLILPYAAISIPFNTLLFTGFLRDFPSEVLEAALVDGTGLTRLCCSVVAPVMRPVIATVLIFNVVYVFNEFPFASILINDADKTTLSLAVSQFQGQYSVDYGSMMAATVLILFPQLVVYFVFQRQVIAGMTLGAVKG